MKNIKIKYSKTYSNVPWKIFDLSTYQFVKKHAKEYFETLLKISSEKYDVTIKGMEAILAKGEEYTEYVIQQMRETNEEFGNISLEGATISCAGIQCTKMARPFPSEDKSTLPYTFNPTVLEPKDFEKYLTILKIFLLQSKTKFALLTPIGFRERLKRIKIRKG